MARFRGRVKSDEELIEEVIEAQLYGESEESIRQMLVDFLWEKYSDMDGAKFREVMDEHGVTRREEPDPDYEYERDRDGF